MSMREKYTYPCIYNEKIRRMVKESGQTEVGAKRTSPKKFVEGEREEISGGER